jgi:hypothetical protein
MKYSVAAILMALTFIQPLAAQKATPFPVPIIPVDSITHLITYEGVTESGGVSASELYHRAFEWFKTYYKNPNEVIRENDSVRMKITGKPRFKILNPADKNGVRTDGGTVQYTITLAVKEGRFRYELSEWNWKQLSNYPCERWLDKKSPSYTPAYDDYLIQLDQKAAEVISSLKNAMTHAKSVKDKDSW